MKISIDERRLAQRYSLITDFLYRLMRGNGTDNTLSSYKITKTLNVSELGLCVTFNEDVEEGDILFAKIDIEGRLVECFCEVKWSEYDIETGTFVAGLEFDYLSPADSMVVINYFKKLMVL